MSADPVEFDRRVAATLASEPEMVLTQMRQHREVVAGLRGEIREHKAEAERLKRRVAALERRLEQYECDECTTTSESLGEHECAKPIFEADQEDFTCR